MKRGEEKSPCFLDHPSAVVNEPIGGLAHLGLAHAYAMQGDTAQDRTCPYRKLDLRPSSSGSRAEGRACSDEKDHCRGTDKTSASSSQCSLGQAEGKERVTRLSRPYMTRITFQKGYIFTRLTERGKVHVIRFRVRFADGKWRHKAETVIAHAERTRSEYWPSACVRSIAGSGFLLKSSLQTLPRATGRRTCLRT